MSRSPVQRPWIRAKPAPVAGFDDVDIEDWDDLFNAVKDRLKKIAAERTRAVQPPAACVDSLGSADGGVLECVQALDQLHVALSNERTRRRQVELELLEAQSGLAKIRAELVDVGQTGPSDSFSRRFSMPKKLSPPELMRNLTIGYWVDASFMSPRNSSWPTF